MARWNEVHPRLPESGFVDPQQCAFFSLARSYKDILFAAHPYSARYPPSPYSPSPKLQDGRYAVGWADSFTAGLSWADHVKYVPGGMHGA